MVIREQNINRYNKNQYTKYNLDMLTYDALCRYVLQDASLVRMEHLYNLRLFFSILDPSEYENDNEKLKRCKFIIKALEARIDNNITDRQLIFIHINGGLSFKVDFIDYDNIDMGKAEVEYMNNLITEMLEYKFLFNYKEEMDQLDIQAASVDFMHRGSIIKKYKSIFQRANNDFRKVEVDNNFLESKFSLMDGVFQNSMTNVYNMATNPSRRLITGMQGLNQMTGGGFESGRVYMFLGTAGVGKSMTLLNIMKQIKDYNTHFKTKDPSKKPCVLMLSMENTIYESLIRLFNMSIEGAGFIGDHNIEDVINKMRHEGGLVVNEASPIDLQIIYRPNRSVNTSYLDTLYDELVEEGFEVIAVVQDHVKRIRSVENIVDIRLELGAVVNEMKSFAAARDIPVITISHLNRDAARTIEEASRKSNQEVGRLLGKSNIGESMLMIDNADCAIIITKDHDKAGRPYMAFNAVKQRERNDLSYFAQPYMMDPSQPNGFGIRLQEDVGTIPCWTDSLHGAPELNHQSTVKISGSSSLTANINDVLDISEEDRKNGMFASQSYQLNHSNGIQTPDPYQVMDNFGDELADIKTNINLFAKLQDSKLEFGRVEDDNDYSVPIMSIDTVDYESMIAKFNEEKKEFALKYGVGA